MNVAFIPVRGGSKSIPLKNIKKINSRPLIYWVLDAAVGCDAIDVIYVSTDSNEIKEIVDAYGSKKIQTIKRSPATATDTATTESAMIEFAQNYDFDTICLIQATSPLLDSAHLIQGFEELHKPNIDSVLSVVRQKRFIWECGEVGFSPSNYEVGSRPRRQDFSGFLVENGAFYLTKRSALLKSGNRISGKIGVVEMPEETYFEIDEPTDWEIVEMLIKRRQRTICRKITIKMFVTDCDGCLTDGGMYYSDDGEESKKFNTKDGMGLSLLQRNGIIVAIITGESSSIVENRAKKLNISECHMGIKDKLSVLKSMCERYGISLSEVAYLGDDINDLECIKSVGLGCCVGNAHESVIQASRFITKLKGGDGAVREVGDFILSIQ